MQHLYSATLHVNTVCQGSIMNISHAFEIVVRHFSSGGRPLLLICCLSKMIVQKHFNCIFLPLTSLLLLQYSLIIRFFFKLQYDVILILLI